MNPARSFGPALYNRNFTSHWIYWVAPISAALITSLAFRMIFWREAPEKTCRLEEQPLQIKNTQNYGLQQEA